MKKRIFVILAAALALMLALTACSMDKKDDLNNGTNTGANNGNGTTNGTNGNNGMTNGTLNDANSGTNGGMNNGSQNGTTNGTQNNAGSVTDNNVNGGTVLPDGNTTAKPDASMGGADTAVKDASVMLNGVLYMATEEAVSQEELGVELLTVMDVVTETPDKDGEARGLDAMSKVYRLKDETQTDSVAVEIDGRYYKATKKV